MTRFIDNWGKEYRVEQEEFKNFSDEMAKNGRRFARIQTLVNPKTGEEWEGADWDDTAKDGLQPWEQRSIDDAKEAFKSRIAEGWQHKQREDESNIVTDTLKELDKGENWVDPDGEQSAAEYHAKNIAAGVGSAAVAGVTGLTDAIQGTVLNAAAFTSRALGAEDAADTIADVRKDASDNIRAMREKATDAIIEGLDAKGMKDARDLVDTGLDVVEGFSGLYALGGVVGGATKGVVKVAGSMGKTVDAAKVGGTVLAGQMAADAYEHALDELEMQDEAGGGEAINTWQKQIVAGARAAMSAATSKLFGKIAGIGIPKETTQKVIEQSLGRSARVLAQEMGEFALINDLNVLADEAGRLAAGVDRLDPEKGFWSRILDESLHGAGMVLGMKSQKILKGGWNAMMPMRAESFTKSMEAMKRAELGAIDAAGGLRVVATTPNGTGVLNTGGIVRAADGEVVTPDGCVITQDGKLRTVGAGRCGELEGGEYGIKVDAPKDGRRFGEDLTENACELVALAEVGELETRKVQLEGLGGEPKAGENGIHLRANKDGTLELASDMPENERRKPVVVLEHADGTIELVTGRKRVEAAKTSGEGEIDAIVIREKDGWTAGSAKVIDIVDNLMKGSPVTDAEAVSAANALGIGYERAVGWGLAQNGNVAAAFRLRENATAGLMNAVEFGHLSLETADAIARNANRRNMPGAVDDIQIADIQLELAEKLKGRSAEEVDAVCRKLRERDMDAGEAADQAIRAKVLDEAIAAAERERLEEAAKKSGLTPEQEAKIDNTPMEREDGTLTTVREEELAERRLAEHSSAISTEGERTALRVREDGVITSARFPEVEIVRSEEGGTAILGLKAEEMLKRENREAITDLLEEVGRSVGAVEIQGAAEVAAAEELLRARVVKRKIQAEWARRKSIKEALDVLAGSGLAKAVHTDQESFDARLKQGKGIEQWLTDTDEVWGFTDGNEIWLNPKTARLETPIHEYGHLGISMCKKVNRAVYDRGITLAKEIGFFKEISENEAYKNSSEESRAEEVLATIIGKRGEEALKGAPATLKAKVKEWLIDFWKAFGEALGLRDITPEQAAKMTLEQVADAIRAEMMSGRRFGEKAEHRLAERSSAINTAKARDIGDGTIRFQVDRNGKKKEYKRPEEALRDFIKELDGVKLDAEQQGVYDVMTGAKNTTDIRKDDIGNLIKLHKGGRGKGARKILSVHYAGKRGKVTAKEVINMGLVIREGRLTFDGSAEHPNSRRYELNAADGARLRVIVDLDKKGNEAVINLYSDREGGNPGHKASPGVKTTSSTPQIVSQEGSGKQEGLKYSIGGIFTGSAADYANRSREGGKDDGPSLLKIGSGEGAQVYGWGLYGSTVRGVAEGYASRDAGAKRRTVKLNGEEIKENSPEVESAVHAIKTWARGNDPLKAAQWLELQASRMRSKIEAGGIKTKLQPIIDRNEAAAKWIRDNADKLEVKDSQEQIYEQTFFTDRAPGDESHLLKWYEPVSEEMQNRLLESAVKEGKASKSGKYFFIGENTMFESGTRQTGEELYLLFRDMLGSPKAASEWLAGHDIDGVKYPVDSYGGKGVKDGETVGWDYVSFRDDNIRVDHKWTNGELKFSVKMIGTDEGVYKTSIDTKNPKTKDGRNTVIFRRDPRECDALLVESETIKAVEKALPENIKTGDKSIKYTESERIAVRNFVKEKAKAQRGEVQNPEFGEIIIGRDFEKEVQTHAISTAREIAAVSSAREIAAKMRHFAASPNEEIKRGRNRYIEYGLATFEFNGERYLVMGEVGVRENSTPYYDQRVVAKLKADTSSLSLHAGMKTESAFDAVYDNRFRILMQAAQEAENNREVMKQVRRQELPTADGEDVAAWLLNGRLRLADDAKYGLAEHSSAISTPVEVMTPSGDLKVMKPVEFAFSSLVELYQWMRGSPALPKILTKAHQEKRAWLGRITKGSEVELNPEMFGIVSKSDEVRIKAELKAEGHFRNEDPTWNLRHSKKQNDFERMMSENLLEDRLRSLAEDRVKGKVGGEYAAPAAALAHEVAALAMEMPANAKMPEIARALRTLGNGIVKIFEKDAAYIDKWKKSGFKVTEVEGSYSMLADALQAVAWWRGYEGGVRQARDGRGKLYEYKTAEDYFKNNHKELCAEVMGMFLTAPEELSNRALGLYYEIVERLAGDQKLLDAYNRLTEGYSGTGHAEAVMSKVMQQWSAKAERDVAQLKKDLNSSQLGTMDNAWMNFKLGYWSRESPAMHHLARKIKSDRELAKANLKIAKKSGNKDEIMRAEANLKEVIAIGDGLVKRMKHENIVKYRGGTADRNYINEFMSRIVGKSLEKHGITIQELDKYLFCQNVIAMQGRAMAFGMSPSEAQKVLDNMRGTMGDVKWRQLEAASMEFHANRERNILSNPYVEEMFGKERIERWKRNAHYVRTERTLSVDEMALLNKGGKNGEKPEDMAIDVQEELDTLMRLHMKKGARSGDHYLKHLVGSLSASERPTKATMMRDMMMAEHARRNHYIANLAELAKEAKLPGFKVVRDMSLRSVDGGERYGTLSYMKDGENYLLIVPKEVERAMQSDADAMNLLVKFNRTVAKAMTTYNIRFAQRNMVRNRETNEANIEWMRPSLLKEGMGAIGLRGPANALELAIERAIVRLPDNVIRNPILGTIWNPKTNMYFINEATRIAKLILVPEEKRRVAEKADRLIQDAMEKGGDMNKAVAKAKELMEDIRKSDEVMKHPMLSDSFQKVSGYGKGGADIEALFRKLDGTDAPREGLERLPYLGKVWSLMKATGRKIEDLNTIEEARTKLVAWLSAEKQKEMLQLKGKKWKYGNASEIADIVATSSGAPMGEMRGTAMNWVEATLTGVFANVAMKGFARTVESARRAPWEWTFKALRRAENRAASILLWGGGGFVALCAAARKLFEDDEEMLQKIDRMEKWGKKVTRAFSMVSDYRIKNYDVLPLAMMGEDNVIALGVPRGDEDRLLTPFVDYTIQQALGTDLMQKIGFNETISGRYGLGEAIGRTILDSGMVPDVARGGIIINVFQNLLSPLIDMNPYNRYMGRQTFDRDLWAQRGERKAEFVWEMTKRLWNDIGGGAILQAPMGAENSEGDLGEMKTWWTFDDQETTIPGAASVFDMLRKGPISSVAMSGFVFMNTKGTDRVEKKILAMKAEEKAVMDVIAMNCLDHLQKTGGRGEIAGIINAGIEKYGLEKDSFGLIERAVIKKQRELARMTNRTTVPFKNLHKGIPDSTYQRIRKSLINTGWEIDD